MKIFQYNPRILFHALGFILISLVILFSMQIVFSYGKNISIKDRSIRQSINIELKNNCLIMSNNKINIGSIYSGNKIDVNFDIKNNSNKNLVIKKIDVSCGCTLMDKNYEGMSINKNSSINISLKIDTAEYIEEKDTYLYLKFFDDITDFHEIVITGKYISKLPKSLLCGTLSKNDLPKSYFFNVNKIKNEEIELIFAESKNKNILTKIKSVNEYDQELEVIINHTLNYGESVNTDIDLVYKDKKNTKFSDKLLIEVDILPEFLISKKSISLWFGKSDHKSFILEIWSPYENKIDLKDIVSTPIYENMKIDQISEWKKRITLHWNLQNFSDTKEDWKFMLTIEIENDKGVKNIPITIPIYAMWDKSK